MKSLFFLHKCIQQVHWVDAFKLWRNVKRRFAFSLLDFESWPLYYTILLGLFIHNKLKALGVFVLCHQAKHFLVMFYFVSYIRKSFLLELHSCIKNKVYNIYASFIIIDVTLTYEQPIVINSYSFVFPCEHISLDTTPAWEF